jgi:hypothetical protein
MSAMPVDPPSPEAPADDADVGYAMRIANESYNWYKIAAIRSRRLYKTLEVTVLVIGAAIPTSAVLFADNASIPAVLGAVVVVLTGLRSIYHWHENYIRFSQAREAVEGERRLYRTGARPYDNAATRDQKLAGAVSRIEQEEMRGWVRIAAEQPKET